MKRLALVVLVAGKLASEARAQVPYQIQPSSSTPNHAAAVKEGVPWWQWVIGVVIVGGVVFAIASSHKGSGSGGY